MTRGELWAARHPGEKLIVAAEWLALAFLLPPVPWAPVLLVAISTMALGLAGVSTRLWCGVLSAPAAFSAFALFPLLWNVGFAWTDTSVYAAPLRSLAAAAAVLLAGVTIPIPDLLALFRRLHVPEPMIDLAFLIYRFSVIAVDASRSMLDAMVLRAPRTGFRRRMIGSAWLASSLLARIMDRARRSEIGLTVRGAGAAVRLPAPASRFSWRGVLWPSCGPILLSAIVLLHEAFR